ncbi:unnamed protein product [Closterium sp. NIES-54]
MLPLRTSLSAAALGASESAVAPGASESSAALGAHASTATSLASTEALHTFILDSGTSRCFFRDSTTLTPLAAPVPVSLADPTWGLVVARASTVLYCPLSSSPLQDAWVDTFTPGGQRVAICKFSWTGRHLATFTSCSILLVSGTLSPYSSLAPPPRSPLAAASPQHALPSPCLWPSQVPALPPVDACTTVSSLRRGQQHPPPHSSEFPPTTAPLQTLHMDGWGPAPIGGTDQERYFLLVVDDYTRYTTVIPLRCKADVTCVLIPWIRANRCQLRERFRRDLPVLRLHYDKGGELSFGLFEELC